MNENNSKTGLKIPTGLPPIAPDGEPLVGHKSSNGMLTKIVFSILSMLVISGLMVGSFYSYSWLSSIGALDDHSTDLKKITQLDLEDNSLVFDSKNKKIGEFFSKYQIHSPFEKIPTKLKQAILAIEDRKFFEHSGFDLKGIARSGLTYITSMGNTKHGGSTITQQVVRNILLSKEKTIKRKTLEIILSYKLEQKISKAKILEIYCNTLFMGFGSYGVAAASKRYFGKDLKDLGTHQFAVLAGLFQSPSRYNPHRYPKRARKRQLQVLSAMVSAGFLTKDEARAEARKPIGYQKYTPIHGESSSSYFVDYVRQQAKTLLKGKAQLLNGGLRIYTTLSSELQGMAEIAIANAGPMLDETAQDAMPIPGPKGKLVQPRIETSILSIDPRNGEILAMVGGRDYKESQFNRITQGMRAPGSAFKPVVYSAALQNGIKWSDLFYVSPVTLNGDYRPKNPSKDYLTETTVMRSFYRSMNATTMEIGQKVGLKKVIAQARNLGIRTPIKKEFGSLLGQSETTMIDLARMISSFPNQGIVVEPIAIKKITDRNGKLLYQAPKLEERSHQAMSKQTAYLMVDGMRNVFKRGTAYKFREFGTIAGGKTGTSNESKDNWFVGYTSDLTTIVWAGTDEYTPIYNNTMGSTIALPTWADYMSKATQIRPNKAFAVPKGITKVKVHHQYGYRTQEGIEMFFLNGKLPERSTSTLEYISRSGGSFRKHITD